MLNGFDIPGGDIASSVVVVVVWRVGDFGRKSLQKLQGKRARQAAEHKGPVSALTPGGKAGAVQVWESLTERTDWVAGIKVRTYFIVFHFSEVGGMDRKWKYRKLCSV